MPDQNHTLLEQMRSDHVIGTVKGPGENNQYVFITAAHQVVKIGEFVYYEVPDLESGLKLGTDKLLQILGKISALRLIDHLPDRIFADPEISPETIAALVGFTYNNPEIYEVTVDVMGHFSNAMGFVNPRRTPAPGARVYLASDRCLTETLNKRQSGDVGSAEVGSLLLRAQGAVPVILDVKELVSTHMAILAGTGSGKSYTAGVLVEELLRPYNRAAVMIFDPHGEYDTLSAIQGHPDFIADGYAARAKVLTPADIKIRISSLDYGDIVALLPQMSDRQQSILSKAFRLMRKHRDGDYRWDIQDLIAAVKEADRQVDEDGLETSGSSASALTWKLERIQNSDYFHRYEHLAPKDLFQPGQVTVLQMNAIDQDEQQVICAALLRQVNQARMDTHRDRISREDENYLPYPVFILVEEAHRFAPANEPSRCKAVLRTILSEGRKFGIGMGLITQRPGKLDSDILSQCMSQFIMRIINPVDQDSLKYGVESAGRDLLRELPALTKGQVIIAGMCVNSPVLCKVRSRLTQHGGETLNAPALWMNYFHAHHVEARTVEKAPVLGRKAPKSFRGVSIE
jgi:uncharacterized protein